MDKVGKVGKIGKICKVDTARKACRGCRLVCFSWFWFWFRFRFSKVDPQNAAADRRDLPVTSALPIHSIRAWLVLTLDSLHIFVQNL